ncbi:MAG: sigma-70 factor domain-containing protein, partial [Chitinophagales bacterium]
DPSDYELMESHFFEKNLDTQTIFLEIDPDDEEDAEEKAEKKKSKAKKSENKPVSDDSVFLYLREIGKIPTLNNEQEIIVTRSIRKGGVDGEKAKRQLVQSNLRLVVSIAKRYASNNIQLL